MRDTNKMKPKADRSSLFFGVIFLLIAGIVGLGGILWKNFIEYTSNVSSLPEVLEGVSDVAPFKANNMFRDRIIFSFAVPTGDLVKFLEMVQPRLNRIVDRTGQSAKIDIVKNELEVVNRVVNGFADFGSISALGYAHFSKTRQIRLVLERFAIPIKRSLILVRKDDPAQTIDDLKGYRMAYKHVYSSSGYISPKKMFTKHGLDVNTFFKQQSFTENFSNSLLGLQNNEYDCVAVSSTFFNEQPKQLQGEFRILAKSDPISGGVYIMKKGYHPAYEKVIINKFLDFSTQFKGTAAFSGMFRVRKPQIQQTIPLKSQASNEK